MSELRKSGQEGADRALVAQPESGTGEDLAELLSTLEEDSFIPVEALAVVAEILTRLHGRGEEIATAENEI